MDDLYSPTKRERYYKQAHHIKVLMRKLQTADKMSEIYNLNTDLNIAVAKLVKLKYDDLTAYKSHITKLLNDINERGN